MGYKSTSVHCVLRILCFTLLHLLSSAQDEDIRSCRTAPCDLVFILDGSWSVEDINFEIVKRWLVNITSSFHIGQKFTQVGVVQYSDDPVLEIPLGKYTSNKEVLKAMEDIEYMGGNTRTGTAIKFATDKLFGLSERGLVGVSRIAVVLTDGKSQDEVLKAAELARKKGVILFAIGVGTATEEAELRDIANKPSSTYVFSVEDYKAISRIIQVIRQKLCEETVCPVKIPVDSRDEKGFDILLHLNLAKKAKKTQGAFYGSKAYEVTSRVDLSTATRDLFPDGLPPSYVFVSTLRYKGSVTKEEWDLWRIQTRKGNPQMAVTLNGYERTVSFTTTSEAPTGTQTVTFSQQTAWKLFDEKWHQLRLLVTEEDVTLYVDDMEIETLPLEPPVGIFINGKTQVGKYVQKESTVPFEIQKLRIYCDPEQNTRETACEIPGVIIVPFVKSLHIDSAPVTCWRRAVGAASDIHAQWADFMKCELMARNHFYSVWTESRIFQSLCSALKLRTKPYRKVTHHDPNPSCVPTALMLSQLTCLVSALLAQLDFRVLRANKAIWVSLVNLDLLVLMGVPGVRGSPGLPGPPGAGGPRGQMGYKGEPGIPGVMGERGIPGLPGQTGKQGEKGSQGSPGISGFPGKTGQMGEKGNMGPPGPSGYPGKTGPQGRDGKDGLPGIQGDKGEVGISGIPGNDGRQGHPGIPGLPGNTGMDGLKGEAGSPGLRGFQGSVGPPGEMGLPGPPGLQGLQGNKGNKGENGNPGIQGAPGSPGSTGVPGRSGQSGHPGMHGIKGSKGQRGNSGERGEMGIKGEKGEHGPPGNNGMTGPVGVKGEQGASGEPGQRGHDGQMGRPGQPGQAGTPGPRGIQGDTGPQGPPGPAARPVTEMSESHIRQICRDILQSELPQLLISDQRRSCSSCYNQPGSPGPPGPIGPQGLRGLPGFSGARGQPGHPGLPGHPGVNGLKGESGFKGEKGSTGRTAVGDPGQPGPTGPTGPSGYGKPGTPGKTGPPGRDGLEGKSGNPGVPGQPGVCDPSMCYGSMMRRDPYSKGPNY